MTALLEMLVPAVGVSLLALACLALLPRAPAELRFWIAATGLAGWAIPWPLLRWTLPYSASETWWALPAIARIGTAVGDLAVAQGVGSGVGAPVVQWLVGAAFAIGATWFLADCTRTRAAVRSWRARSTDAEALRELLPAHLRTVDVEIRTVRDSPYAAVSGYLRPTIWIGDELRDRETVRVALLHECWHVRRRDPLKILLLTALRRAYWWNPLAYALASRAALLLEAACDRRCSREIGKETYVAELARTMLVASRPPPLPLAAAAGMRSTNLLRLDLLNRETCMRARDHVVLWAFAASALTLAACQSLEPRAAAATRAAPAMIAVGGAVVEGDNSRVTANHLAFDKDSVRFELSGGVRVETTAERIVMIHSDRFSVGRDSITLTGHVLLAIDGTGDLETDELTIRTHDGRPLDLQPASGAEIEGREVSITMQRGSISNVHLQPLAEASAPSAAPSVETIRAERP